MRRALTIVACVFVWALIFWQVTQIKPLALAEQGCNSLCGILGGGSPAVRWIPHDLRVISCQSYRLLQGKELIRRIGRLLRVRKAQATVASRLVLGSDRYRALLGLFKCRTFLGQHVPIYVWSEPSLLSGRVHIAKL